MSNRLINILVYAPQGTCQSTFFFFLIFFSIYLRERVPAGVGVGEVQGEGEAVSQMSPEHLILIPGP